MRQFKTALVRVAFNENGSVPPTVSKLLHAARSLSKMPAPLLFDEEAAKKKLAGEAVLIVLLGLLSDFMLLTIIIPFVPQLLSTPPPAGAGVYSTTMIGLLFSAKPIVQILANPFAGLLTDRVGPRRPLLGAVAVLAASTVCFAEGRSYALLFAARAVQVRCTSARYWLTSAFSLFY